MLQDRLVYQYASKLRLLERTCDQIDEENHGDAEENIVDYPDKECHVKFSFLSSDIVLIVHCYIHRNDFESSLHRFNN